MDIRGIWKVKEMRLPSPDGELVFTPGNLPDDEQFVRGVQIIGKTIDSFVK